LIKIVQIELFLGPKGGLFFGSQFNPEDWTPGPHFYGEGFRIAIHEPGTTVRTLSDYGLSMRPQLTAELALTQKNEYYLVRITVSDKIKQATIWVLRSNQAKDFETAIYCFSA